ncbi:MAG: hypothetical protein V7K50_17335 [Nostoc sp.]
MLPKQHIKALSGDIHIFLFPLWLVKLAIATGFALPPPSPIK